MFRNVTADLRSHVHPNYTGYHYWIRVIAKALFTPAIHVTVLYRISAALYRFPLTMPLAFPLRTFAIIWAGTEIHPSVRIGPGLCIVHSQKVVIGPGVVIGSNLRIHHGCTIAGDLGRGVEPSTACPVLGDDITIGLDAYVMGPVTVGDGAIIGAQSLVNKDVEPYTLVAGSPAKLIRNLADPTPVDGDGPDPIEA